MGVVHIANKWSKKSILYKKKKKEKLSLKEKISVALELPEEITLDAPRISLTGNKKLFVENYKGILEYNSDRIRLKTTGSLLVITGDELNIKEISLEDIFITGNINSLEFKS